MVSSPKGPASTGRAKRRTSPSRQSTVEEVVKGCSRQDAQVLLLKLHCYQRSQRVVLYTPEEVEKHITTIQGWSVV